MARPLRIEYPGALYHITSRGNSKQEIFLDDKDRSIFLELLSTTVSLHEWLCYSYCLMGNHYHLLVETPKANLSRGMHWLNGAYAQRYNRRHSKVGHFFQGRYHAVIVDKEEYLLEVSRYIVLNPVRAGLVEDPAHYRWSSYLEVLGRRKAAEFLDTAYSLSLFSQPGRSSIEEYEAFVLNGLGSEIWSKLRGNLILGNERFSKELKDRFDALKDCRDISRKERFAIRPSLSEIIGDSEYGLEERNSRIVKAKVEYGYTLKEIAVFLGLHRNSIWRIVASKTKDGSHFEV